MQVAVAVPDYYIRIHVYRLLVTAYHVHRDHRGHHNICIRYTIIVSCHYSTGFQPVSRHVPRHPPTDLLLERRVSFNTAAGEVAFPPQHLAPSKASSTISLLTAPHHLQTIDPGLRTIRCASTLSSGLATRRPTCETKHTRRCSWGTRSMRDPMLSS